MNSQKPKNKHLSEGTKQAKQPYIDNVVILYQTQQLQYCPLASRQGFNGIHLFSKVTPSLTG
ncbi:hypothetical protein, partial [Faucicola atlantae]|uniref:hypothetical protein n=1 Tax=Faucicola atlantae TaxID=34059 RepID=UPI001C12C56C